MNRGDVYWYYGPATPTEKDRKKRPVILVSSAAANQNPNYPYVSVVPVTGSIEHIYALELIWNHCLASRPKHNHS
jgi:mRNA-degrading endonuclease toxin of MazEF toxin-antitoxin module